MVYHVSAIKTNSIENQTKIYFSDAEKEIASVPRPIVAMVFDYPNGHLIPFHQHNRSQFLYTSSGIMTVSTVRGIWVVPPLRAVWIPALTDHQVGCSGKLSMRTLYLIPGAASNLPEECCVLSVPPLLRELILHAVTLPRLYKLNSLEGKIMNMILDLVQILKAAPLDLPVPTDDRLKKITEALTVNPGDNRRLEDWGKSVGATNRTLARLFRFETGMSFRQWRQQMRILESLRRLGL